MSIGSWVRQSLAGPVAVALVAPLLPVELAHEPRRPTPSDGWVYRKDLEEACEPESVETLATLHNIRTGEAMVLSEHEPSEQRFSQLLQDRVTGSSMPMDPKLIELLRKLACEHAPARIELVSGYRSWKLNELLRKKGRRVASHSQHTLGEAVDFRLEGVTTLQLRQAIERTGWQGGIGYYPKASDRFVHADAGPKRTWIGR
jgi:uncharacterized protein YcbK (DUF882 family)